MTLIRRTYNPMFDMLQGMINTNDTQQRNTCNPKVNIYENTESFELHLAAPGFKKDEISIALDNNVLTISSAKEVSEDEAYTRREFLTGSFCRSFSIPKNINVENISAEFADGILKLSLPKKPEFKREIQIA